MRGQQSRNVLDIVGHVQMAHILEVLAFLGAQELHVEAEDLQYDEDHEHPRKLLDCGLRPLDQPAPLTSVASVLIKLSEGLRVVLKELCIGSKVCNRLFCSFHLSNNEKDPFEGVPAETFERTQVFCLHRFKLTTGRVAPRLLSLPAYLCLRLLLCESLSWSEYPR